MKWLLLSILFAPIIYLALKERKWYLFLVIAFVGILPEQLSVELHEKLPMLSATRILIMVLALFWLWDKWKSKKLSLPISLVIYLGINLLISVINLRNGMDEINRMFVLIFERVLLVIMTADLVSSREEFEKCVDFLIMGSVALAVIGIVQTVFDYDIASVLHLQETEASITLPQRMGLTRAYGTTNAIAYGCYCAFMTLPIYYRIEQTGKRRYALAFALNFLALICTFTRSAWLCIGGIFLVMLMVRRGKMISRLLLSGALVIVICAGLCLAQPKLFDALVETGKSSINTILDALPESVTSQLMATEPADTVPPDTEKPTETTEPADTTEPVETTEPTEPTKPDSSDDKQDLGFTLSENFGMNAEDPTYSRMLQWTAVEYMIDEGEFLFGYGYNAVQKGRLHYYYERWGQRWVTATYLDVGLVALITESGLIGGLSYLFLLGYMLITAWRNREKTKTFDFYKMSVYMIPLYLLLNFLAAFLVDDVVWLFIALFYAYRKLRLDESRKEAAEKS